MAIARLNIKVGGKGKAAKHAAYIAREDVYAKRLEKGERLEAKGAGNMPAWAQANPQHFWLAADTYERSNGTAYREMEIALPRELHPAQRETLVRAWVEQELGDRHAYQWAIHVPTAADGGEQPHAHLMFSERQTDGIDRDPAQYFKRYNGKVPENGGCRKGYGPHAGQALTAAERRADLLAQRQRWEQTCNDHLARAGVSDRIDMRSLRAQGKKYSPEKKLLPSEWRDPAVRERVQAFREAKADYLVQWSQLATLLPGVMPGLDRPAENDPVRDGITAKLLAVKGDILRVRTKAGLQNYEWAGAGAALAAARLEAGDVIKLQYHAGQQQWDVRTALSPLLARTRADLPEPDSDDSILSEYRYLREDLQEKESIREERAATVARCEQALSAAERLLQTATQADENALQAVTAWKAKHPPRKLLFWDKKDPELERLEAARVQRKVARDAAQAARDRRQSEVDAARAAYQTTPLTPPQVLADFAALEPKAQAILAERARLKKAADDVARQDAARREEQEARVREEKRAENKLRSRNMPRPG